MVTHQSSTAISIVANPFTATKLPYPPPTVIVLDRVVVIEPIKSSMGWVRLFVEPELGEVELPVVEAV